ncbi:hypothetical protein [Flavobacterium collinsii]|uniref:Uncharacterized protein n=1 Tax=Flavobacterium collinsii TaxID=1114861 RepID=A0A9W4TEY6_9FLAO|nr:hypothetical protein [Flavobacterium collinsii]CAI2766008.1 conserved protein of unknown function [Flavobacterium collinsii]
MKKLLYMLFISITVQNISGQDLKPEYRKFVKKFIDNVKNNRKEAVAEAIKYPLRRENPIPSIKNKTEFVKRYDEIFDTKLKTEISQSNPAKDWSEVGWRGIMLNQGTLWMDTDGKVFSIIYQSKVENYIKSKLIASEKSKLHPSITKFKEPQIIIETAKFRVRIDDLGNDNYRYASWSIKQSMSEKPDLIITNGKWFHDGTGGNNHYDFKKGNFLYQCYITVLGTKDSAPATLTICQNGREILNQDAKIVPR